ncbi:MAG TPA: CdaR family protein [Pyrinomonadaceae bacterium]|nr:CdaR family protein [Pyrinomonadaceae bacterium]
MQSTLHWVTNNWFLKIVSILLAALLWAAVSNQESSEIGLEVPLEYRNIPARLEITGDTTNTVQVHLRGASNVIKGITAKDVATKIDLTEMRPGEKIIALSPQNVQAPFGADVIRVNPSSVRFTLEHTLTKTVPIIPTTVGRPLEGYEVAQMLVRPNSVEVEGPESRVNSLSSISTVPIRLDRKQTVFEQTLDLDVPDPQIRIQHPAPVSVKVEIHRKR